MCVSSFFKFVKYIFKKKENKYREKKMKHQKGDKQLSPWLGDCYPQY